jgi:hypothetical protein
LSASRVVLNEKPKEQTGIIETKSITLKLWGEYLIDVPQNYIKHQKVITNSKQKLEGLGLWSMYPSFEGFTSATSVMFNKTSERNNNQDNNVVEISIYPFPPFKNDNVEMKRRMYGQDGIKGLLETHKNYKPTSQEKQPFSNPIEYSKGDKNKTYIYLYDSGGHAVAINCFYGSVHEPFTRKRCNTQKIWGNHVGISYEFGISHLSKFGQIEQRIDKLLNNFNLRKLKHD